MDPDPLYTVISYTVNEGFFKADTSKNSFFDLVQKYAINPNSYRKKTDKKTNTYTGRATMHAECKTD